MTEHSTILTSEQLADPEFNLTAWLEKEFERRLSRRMQDEENDYYIRGTGHEDSGT